MGLLQYAKDIWVGGKRIFARDRVRAQETDGNGGRRAESRMQQLRLRLYTGERTEVVVVLLNDGAHDILVNGFVLPPGHYLENIAHPLPHPTALYPKPEDERILATIIDDPITAVSNDPPPYAASYRIRPTT
jgi:hypothetical protein